MIKKTNLNNSNLKQSKRVKLIEDLRNYFWIFKINGTLVFSKKISADNWDKEPWNQTIFINEEEDMIKVYNTLNGYVDLDINSMNINNIINDNQYLEYKDIKLIADIRNYAKKNYIIDEEYNSYLVYDNELYDSYTFSKVKIDKLENKDMITLIKDCKYWPLYLPKNKDKSFNFIKWWNKQEITLKVLNDKNNWTHINNKKLANIFSFILLKQLAKTEDRASLLLNWAYLNTTNLKPNSILFWLFGEGGDGKSIFKDILISFLNSKDNYLELKANHLANQTNTQDFISLDFQNKLMCIGDEVSQFDLDRIKDLTSETCKITSQRKNKESISFDFRGKITLINNVKLNFHKILKNDNDGWVALARRLIYFETMTKKERIDNNLFTDFTFWLFNKWKPKNKKIIKETFFNLAKNEFYFNVKTNGLENMFNTEKIHSKNLDDILEPLTIFKECYLESEEEEANKQTLNQSETTLKSTEIKSESNYIEPPKIEPVIDSIDWDKEFV